MTEQRKRFCDKYFETLNGTQSAIYAGYSEDAAKSYASQLLDDPEVQAYLQTLRAEYQEKSGVTKERLIEEYKKIAFFDIREIYDVDGGLINVKQIDDSSAAAIAGIKSTEAWDTDEEGNRIIIGTNKEVKIFDKIRALQDLGKHLGIFEKDNLQSRSKTTNVINLGSGKNPNEATPEAGECDILPEG